MGCTCFAMTSWLFGCLRFQDMGLLGCYSTVSRLVMVRLGDTEQRLTTPGQGIIVSIIRVILTCFRAWAPGNESVGSKGYVMHVNAFGGGIILTQLRFGAISAHVGAMWRFLCERNAFYRRSECGLPRRKHIFGGYGKGHVDLFWVMLGLHDGSCWAHVG